MGGCINIIDEKRLLRVHFKKLRYEIDAKTHFQDSILACQHAAELLVRLNIQTCAIYHPVNGELSPLTLPQLLPNIHWSLPYLHDGIMGFSAWSGGELQQGQYGIMQPANIVPHSPQAIITPLLAADKTGVRLGYGGGYYDRYFSTRPSAIRIGIGFNWQLTEQLPNEPHDLALHYFISNIISPDMV